MATETTVYLNGPSLSSATAVFSNSALTTLAPDGYYSQGGIYRQQVSGVLLPQVTCSSCAIPCGGEPIVDNNVYGWVVFKSSIDLGSATGAVIITVDVGNVPDGIQAQFNSVLYNKLSSPIYGLLQAPPSKVTFIGRAADDCGLVQIYPYIFTVFRYNGAGFDITPDTQNMFIDPDMLQLTAGGPGECVMVIPKVVAGPSVVEVSIFAACPMSSFTLNVGCPAELTGFQSGVRYDTALEACLTIALPTYYSAPVTGSPGSIDLYDYVFSDPNGQNPLSNGFYFVPTAGPGSDLWYEVTDGIITNFGSC